MPFIIRRLVEEDVNEVYELGLEREEFTTESGSFWSPVQLKAWSESKSDVVLVAEDEGKIIGFSLYAQHIPTGKVTWENLYVLPEYRKSGAGSALIERGMEELGDLRCKYVMCCVNANDQTHFAEYLKKFGFKIYGSVLWVDKVINDGV